MDLATNVCNGLRNECMCNGPKTNVHDGPRNLCT